MPRERSAVLRQVSTQKTCAKTRLDGIYGVDSGWTGKDKSQNPHPCHGQTCQC